MTPIASEDRRARLELVVGGALTVLVAQGTGRFILTPLLPLMQGEAGLDAAAAGLLGSFNFAGYLLGAIAVSLLPGLRPIRLVWSGLAAVMLGTLAMVPTTDLAIWLAGRFVAGLGGALLFLGGVAAAATGLAARGHAQALGQVFIGVGVGICLGAVVAILVGDDWRLGWIVMALLSASAAIGIRRLDGGRGATAPTGGRLRVEPPLIRVGLAYALGGFGFGAGTTFFVRVFTTDDPTLATFAWFVAGIIAIPSTPLWGMVARRLGIIRALMAALCLHGAGIGLVGLSTAIVPMTIAGLLIGGTFMGITSLSLAYAREAAPGAPAQASALVTCVFGLGQVSGPIVSGHLLDGYGPLVALLVPAVANFLGAAILVPDLSSPPANPRPRA